jgi:UDP-glucose-4-epimerase GalE
VPDRPILVTGGAGYIGSHTCKALASAGFTPIAYDNLSRGHRHAVKWGPLVEADLAECEALRRSLLSYRPLAVIHLAALAYVGESMQEPEKYFRNNVAYALTLLEAMHETGVPRMVFSSTCAVYGVPDRVPITEDASVSPISPYGESKLIVERMLRWFGSAHGMSSVVLRYFNAAGADPDGLLGEEHEPEPHLIPRVIQTALGQYATVPIFGTDYPTPDGTAIRDYTHVSDLAAAHVLALRLLLANGASEILNLGTGQGHSVCQIVRAVESLHGRPVRTVPKPRRPGDPAVLVANGTRAASLMGWRPRHSTIEELVGTAYSWFRRNKADVFQEAGQS